MRKLAVIGTAMCFCAAAIVIVIIVGRPERLDSKARRQWKDHAIVQIAKQTGDATTLVKEIEAMKTTPVESEWDTWISADLIVMTNGQWMAYRNVCQKEAERIPDLFLGLGSDGRWYYSTYHFCVRMINLKDVVGQPGSLKEFITTCALKEFDGHSDDCLRPTNNPH